MDSITPQGEDQVHNDELGLIFQLIREGRGPDLAKIVEQNPYVIYQVVELITERIFASPDQYYEILVFCLQILQALVQKYGIPVILLFNNMETAMKLLEIAQKGLAKNVSEFLVPCFEAFSFDPERAILTYLTTLWIQLDPDTTSFPTKEIEKEKKAFAEFFKKVQEVLEACQDPIHTSEENKKLLEAEVKKLLSSEDFESKDFNVLEQELAMYYLNELVSARDKLEPQPVRKSSAEEEVKIGDEGRSPAQNRKIVEKEENQSPIIPKNKQEEGHLARYKTSFVLYEKVYEDEGKATEYKNYRYPFDNSLIGVLQKTICGFLNRRGGRIYLGIHDDKTVYGIRLTPKQRDDLKLDIQSLIKNFEPDIINSETVSIVFIPVKQHVNSRPIPGLFVVKIIVKQGDPSQLYSVQKRLLECYIRNDARVDLLSARETSDHIRKRDRNPDKMLPDEEFEDPKPELLVDNYEKNLMENMNNSKVRFDKALKHVNNGAGGAQRGGGPVNKAFGNNANKTYQNQNQGQFHQNLKNQQQQHAQDNINNMMQKFQLQNGQQQQNQNKPVVFQYHQPPPQNQQGGFGGFNQQHQNHGPKNNKFGSGPAGNWKERAGIDPAAEIFEVFIEGLPMDITQKEFETLVRTGNSFSIINPRRIKLKNGLVKGFANFANIGEAEKFIMMFNDRKLGGSVLAVDFNFA